MTVFRILTTEVISHIISERSSLISPLGLRKNNQLNLFVKNHVVDIRDISDNSSHFLYKEQAFLDSYRPLSVLNTYR